MTGSIGVYMKHMEASDLFDKVGVSFETIRAGRYKAWGGLERPLEEHEREMVQSVIDDTYEQFVEAVYTGRRKPLSDLLLRNPDEVASRLPERMAVRPIPSPVSCSELLEEQFERTEEAWSGNSRRWRKKADGNRASRRRRCRGVDARRCYIDQPAR